MTSIDHIEQYLDMKNALESIFEDSLGGVAIIGNDYRIEYVNDRVCEILERKKNELVDKDFRQFVHKDSIEAVSERYENRLLGYTVKQTYNAQVLDSQNCSKNVQIRSTVLKTKGNEIKLLAQIIDITQEKRTQEALCKQEHLYKTLVSTMNEGLGIVDDNGIITFVNKALCNMLDYSENELLGKRTMDILYGPDKDEVSEKIQQRVAGKSERFETHLIQKSGRLISTRISAAPIICHTGKCTGSSVIFTDITKEKSIEKQLQTTRNRALLYLDLMKHDIRNCLQEIQVTSELLQFQNNDPSVNAMMNDILKAIQKSSSIIAESRTIEQLADLPLRDRMLDQILVESVKDVSIILEDLSIELSISVTDAQVKADDYLEVLLSDLLSNAYIHNPSTVKRVWVTLTRNSDTYELLISDNGTGIPANIKKNLFKSGSRIGIGLHLIHHIVEKYGGTIEISDRIEGDPTQGTTIEIAFPIWQKSYQES